HLRRTLFPYTTLFRSGTTTSGALFKKCEFRARRFLGGGHVQTIASFLLPRRFTLPKSEEKLIEVEPGIHVLCHCHWQIDRQAARSEEHTSELQSPCNL